MENSTAPGQGETNSLRPKEETKSQHIVPKTDIIGQEDLARVLNVSISTLLTWSNKGYIRKYGFGQRTYYFMHEIEEDLRKNKFKPQNQ